VRSRSFGAGSGDAADPRIETLGDPLDDAALAGGVAALEDDDHLELVVLDPVLQLDQFALQPKQLLEVDGPVERLVRSMGGLRVPELLEPAFAELQFDLLVKTVAEVGIDALAQGFVAGGIRRGHFASSVCHAPAKIPVILDGGMTGSRTAALLGQAIAGAGGETGIRPLTVNDVLRDHAVNALGAVHGLRHPKIGGEAA
jgi:hypothetical protein